jgi:hypothetical protein
MVRLAMTTRAILIKARALIEKGWCQGPMAEDQFGNPVQWADSHAVRFCIMGACYRTGEGNWEQAKPLLQKATGQPRVVFWSERKRRTKAEILAAFDKAIGMAK